MNLWKFIKDHMLQNPKQKISENKASLSFEDTVIWSEIFAKKLSGINCCAILCNSEMATSMALLACFAAGITAVPISIRYGEKQCNKILNTIDPDGIIMDIEGEIAIYKLKDSKYIIPNEHPALIMCTSGTTGTPKGAMLSEHNIITNVSDIADYFKITTDDTILISRPLYHCAVLTGEFLTALIKGTNIRFYSKEFNPGKMISLINEYKITAFCGTPTLIAFMTLFDHKDFTQTLNHICISGECMHEETGKKIRKEFPKCNIYHVYGLTEASPRVSYLSPEHFTDYPDCVGIPLKSVSIKILSKNGLPCKENEEGILYIKGENIMMGYYNEPQKTRKVLKDNWLCTGDIALINEAGFLKIKGRNDDLIIKAGMNIYPAEIEDILKQDTRIKEVLIYGVENRLFGTQIGMKVVGEFTSIKEIKQLCIKLLPSFQIPTIIELVDELPKNASGKIIRGTANDRA